MAVIRSVLCRPFVGRREELAYLRERRLEAGASHGGLVLITGDAGVGKSRLISEFCDSLAYSKWRIGYGPCLEFARRPYGPILDVLTRLDASPSVLAPAATKQQQFDAIVERFASIASRSALVVVIEDLHWADAATLDLLTYLGTKLDRMRALVLASIRSDELHPDHPAAGGVANLDRIARARRIDLAPLVGIELRTFITEALAGITLPDETRRAIALAGDGNPFFTEELLKSAVERTNTHAARGAPVLPKTVRATLLERLRPFTEAERHVVAQAAVIGRIFSLSLLAATLGTEPVSLLPTMRRARDFQLLEEVTPAVFRFRHGLTREAIYGDFLGAELRPLHGTIAHALEGVPEEERSLEALAYHSWAAGDSERSARYNELAGDAAGRVHAHEDSIAFYERALDTTELDPIVRGAIVRKVADRRQALGWVQEANATYSLAADIFRDAGAYEREAGCRVDAAVTAYKLGATNPTGPLTAMLERLQPDEYLARSRAHLGLAWLAATFWFPTRAGHHLAQVDPRALTDALDVRLRYHNVAAWVAMTVGDIEGFRAEHAARLDAARASGLVDTLSASHSNGAACFCLLGLHDEALSNIEAALRIARAERGRSSEEAVQAFAAMCYLAAGDLRRAYAAVEAVPVTTENQVTTNNAMASGVMIGALLDDRSLIEKWFDGFEAAISPDPETSCGAPFAEIMVRRGRQADAALLLQRAIPDCERVRGNMMTLLAAGRYGNPADRFRAREQLAGAADAPTELVERHALTLFDAITCRREGRSDEAAALALEAAKGFRRLRFPLLEAEALELAGEPRAALALYRRCGATYHVRRLATEHPASSDGGETIADTAPSVLSKRELEIASRAARGASNLDIARELSISHKTVEKHLASVFLKLDITSRKQLGAYLAAER